MLRFKAVVWHIMQLFLSFIFNRLISLLEFKLFKCIWMIFSPFVYRHEVYPTHASFYMKLLQLPWCSFGSIYVVLLRVCGDQWWWNVLTKQPWAIHTTCTTNFLDSVMSCWPKFLIVPNEEQKFQAATHPGYCATSSSVKLVFRMRTGR